MTAPGISAKKPALRPHPRMSGSEASYPTENIYIIKNDTIYHIHRKIAQKYVHECTENSAIFL